MKSTQMDLLEPIASEAAATSKQQAIGKKAKILYRGYFNLNGGVIIRRTQAFTERQAKALMLRRIAREKGLAGMGGLFKGFDGTKDNFKIEREDRP